MELNTTERDAAARLAAALRGSLVVMDVTASPVAPAPAWDAPEATVRTGACGCCGKRRQLVAFTSIGATEPDICFRCGSDRAQGVECTSKPREYTQTFSDSDWTAQ